MNPDDFANGPGRIDPFEGIPCYRPASLPPDVEYTDDIVRVYGDAQYALGRLTTLHRDIDNENLLIAPFVVREAAMSSQIEGTDVTVSDIILHDVDPNRDGSSIETDDVREAYNYVDAIKRGFAHLDDGGDITVDLLTDLHATLLDDVRGGEDRPGQLRDVPVHIGRPNESPENARFVPANPDTVDILLDQLVSYVGAGNYPALIDLAITHYQFETIHPFRDGNGRLGRLLMMLQLYQANLLPEPYLYLSAYFNHYRRQYFDHLLAVSAEGEWEEWIVFVLDAVAEQAIDAYRCGVELKEMRERYRGQFPNRPAVRDVIDHCFEEPYLTAPRAIEATGRSKQAVYDAIDALEDAGIVEEVSDSQRYRVYRASEVLGIVGTP